jgi:hypothetical protein
VSGRGAKRIINFEFCLEGNFDAIHSRERKIRDERFVKVFNSSVENRVEKAAEPMKTIAKRSVDTLCTNCVQFAGFHKYFYFQE